MDADAKADARPCQRRPGLLFLAGALAAAYPVWMLLPHAASTFRTLHCGEGFTPDPVTRRPPGLAPWAGAPLAALAPPSTMLPACAFVNGTPAALFLHANSANAWRVILDDTVRMLQHSPLAACGVEYFYSFPAGETWPYEGADAHFRPINASRRTAGLPHAEQTALSAVYEWCAERPAALVAYTHDKGSRRSPEELNVFLRQWDWRRVHEYFQMEVPQGCFDALLRKGYDTCGANLRKPPQAHYSGNFWWARCDYVRRLVHPMDYRFSEKDFLSPEFWIGSGEGVRAFNCFNSNIQHFSHEFPRSIYVGETCDVHVPST